MQILYKEGKPSCGIQSKTCQQLLGLGAQLLLVAALDHCTQIRCCFLDVFKSQIADRTVVKALCNALSPLRRIGEVGDGRLDLPLGQRADAPVIAQIRQVGAQVGGLLQMDVGRGVVAGNQTGQPHPEVQLAAVLAVFLGQGDSLFPVMDGSGVIER